VSCSCFCEGGGKLSFVTMYKYRSIQEVVDAKLPTLWWHHDRRNIFHPSVTCCSVVGRMSSVHWCLVHITELPISQYSEKTKMLIGNIGSPIPVEIARKSKNIFEFSLWAAGLSIEIY